MLIDDPNVTNSTYTKLLNDRYPSRKYLRHNLTSWLRCNKKNDDILVKLLNPKFKLDDIKMKKLTHKSNELIEAENDITSIEDAKNIIELLKLKLMEYEVTNNKNIETANEYINKLNEENEFLRKKLMEGYDKIAIAEQYGDSVANEHDYVLADLFRQRWLTYNGFQMLKYSMISRKLFRYRYDDYKYKMNQILKLKAFLSLEKNRQVSKYSKRQDNLYRYNTFRKVFNSLRYNVYITKIFQRFKNIQRTVRTMVYFREMKYNSLYSRYYKEINKKALYKYYYSLTTKTFKGLRINTLKFKKKEEKGSITFLQFFKNADMDLRQKQNMTKGIIKLKQFVDKNIQFENNKIINHPVKAYALDIYFNRWRHHTLEYKHIIQYKIIRRGLYLKCFFKKLLGKAYYKRLIAKVQQILIFKSFFRKMSKAKEKKVDIQANIGTFMKKFYYKLFFKYMGNMLVNQPYLRYVILTF
jgi:hypothetical protein